MILVTAHRRESFGSKLESMLVALRQIAERNSDVVIAFPVHLNPKVRGPAHQILGDVDRIHMFEPTGYLAFMWMLQSCHFVLTDSGGIQEEAPSFGKPVLVMRAETERAEGIDAGCSELVGVDTKTIVERSERLLRDDAVYEKMSGTINPYGDGRASIRVVDAIDDLLN
jgi:UDP-N-acetylglucosamine 2-epimerase